jgi:hypothetical protein
MWLDEPQIYQGVSVLQGILSSEKITPLFDFLMLRATCVSG